MIFCVDDDSTIRDIEVYTLNQTGFDAKGLADAYELFDALKTETPQLIILDIMMPGMDGIEALQKLRENRDTCKIPVIMATAKGTEIDKIQGLDTGADDYLVKPFGMMEMVSRVKAVLRRYVSDTQSDTISFGKITLNDKEHTVKIDGEKITLTLKEYELLKIFMRNPGTVFSRDKLLFEIWGVEHTLESRTVDMHIKTLRQKLGSEATHIETVIGVGYKMGE